MKCVQYHTTGLSFHVDTVFWEPFKLLNCSSSCFQTATMLKTLPCLRGIDNGVDSAFPIWNEVWGGTRGRRHSTTFFILWKKRTVNHHCFIPGFHDSHRDVSQCSVPLIYLTFPALVEHNFNDQGLLKKKKVLISGNQSPHPCF